MLTAYKTKIYPNNKQVGLFRQYCGAARFVYNWALDDRKQKYEAGNPTNYYEQKKRFNALKKEQFPWIFEIPYIVQEEAFRNLDKAYKNFFRRVKASATPGFPKFKSKAKGLGSFTLRTGISVIGNKIRLGTKIGWTTLAEDDYFPNDGFEGRILKATISEQAGNWFVSLQVELNTEPEKPVLADSVIGLDAGILHAAVLSDGRVFDAPKSLKANEKKLARLQRELSRREKGSANRKKTQRKIARLHYKISNVRKDFHHYASNATLKHNPAVVVVEDLNVKGMMQNGHLAKALSDVAIGGLLMCVKYKAIRKGIEVVEADRWYASSKTCSGCGAKKTNLTLADRVYRCEVCGLEIDRDLNAAKNLAGIVKGGSRPDCLGS